jgi:hypothetical protein
MSWRLNSPKYLLSNWKLNGHVNDLIRGYNGSWVGTESYIENAFGRQAADLDGSSEIVSSDFPDITTGDFSVFCWINNVQTLTPGFAYAIVTDKETINGTKVGWSFQLNGADVVKGLNFRINDGSQANDVTIGLSTDRRNLLSDGCWHFVGVTVDRDGYVTLYVDNFSGEITLLNDEKLTLSNDQDLTIGVYGNGSSQPFTGGIGDIKIYDTVLTQDEVRKLYIRDHL